MRNRKMKRSILCLAAAALFFAFSSAVFAGSREVTVSAAISLKNVFEEMGRVFESQNKGVKIIFNFGASGDLAAQIEAGAPVDVFAPAAVEDMKKLERHAFVLKESRQNFASNSLVLVAPTSSRVPLSSFKDLTKPGIKRIASGNPESVPAGRYAEETFKYEKISDMIKDKLVFGENVRQVLDYVSRGEVDAAVVYRTDALLKQGEVRIIVEAPEAAHHPVLYPIAVVKGAKNEQAGKAFIAFVLSNEGKTILKKYGFNPAPKRQ